MQRTVSITVTGRVQGVFYRQSTKEKAQEFAITGEVRNNSDGTVSIIATGERDNLDKLISWCHIGPPRAQVVSVVVTDVERREFLGFEVKRG